MAIQMSNFDNFDIDQISSKFAQRQPFVYNFYCKKIFILGSFDNTENGKRQFFMGHPIYHCHICHLNRRSIDYFMPLLRFFCNL